MNEACCTRPRVESKYEPNGTYEELKSGMKCYKVGPSSATRGVIMVYDALGYSQPQLLGADMVAAELQALVFSPDYFRGDSLNPAVFTTTSAEERNKIVGAWLGPTGAGNMEQGIANTATIHAELKAKYPSVEKWAVHGYCWGGKLSALLSAKGTVFSVSGASHPGRIDPKDAHALTIPHISLLSGEDGSDEEAAAYAKALRESGQDVVYERFQDQVHGWMAARANFEDGRAKKEFERGYDLVARFFEKHL